MDLVLSGLQEVELYVYLDDIIVFATDLEEHMKKFRRLLKRLDEANLMVELSKCQFLQREASFLGHIAGNGKIRLDPKKIEAVRSFPVPSNKKQIKPFLGLAGYYHRFVKDFAKIAYPLSKLLRKKDNKGKQSFMWGEEQQQAFEKLREALCSEPVLRAPDLSKEFIVTTDASDFALGAILGQGELGNDHACIYASRGLRGPDLRYSTYDRELLTVVFAKEQFRPFLYGRKKPDLRFNRLKVELRGYEFEIIYRPGPRNFNADALSRNPLLRDGEDNPDRPRVELYTLAEKQEKEDNYNEYDPPAKLRYATRAAAKRNRKQNEDHESTSDGSLGNPKKIPKQNSSSESDEREEFEEEFGKELRKRKYTKQAEKKTGRRFPVCDKVSGRNMASTESILSQAEIDKKLPYIRKEINMEGEIGAASTPLGPRSLPLPSNQRARTQTLR